MLGKMEKWTVKKKSLRFLSKVTGWWWCQNSMQGLGEGDEFNFGHIQLDLAIVLISKKQIDIYAWRRKQLRVLAYEERYRIFLYTE